MVKVTFEGCKVSLLNTEGVQSLINACIAATVGATYHPDTFQEAMIDWLAERDFIVMTQDEFNEALAAARADEHYEEVERDEFGRIMDLPKAKAFDSEAEYQAGYNDAYNEEEKQGDSEAYLAGYKAGENAVWRELAEEDEAAEGEE